ncbi:MAG: PaaI family thioesterase [Deltaproteobacteria bacterium]|nr:PaaI family thioesterase [Deltaproteobacteria bacterium]
MATQKRYALDSLFGPADENIVSHTPHAQYLGIKAVETGPGFAVMKLPYRHELVGDPARGVVFGGVITTLIDQASGLAVACSLEELTAIATIDLRIDYLRAAEPGRDLYTRSECYKLTRNIAFVRASAWEHDIGDPFATCQATFMVGANNAGSPFSARFAKGAKQ